jgi:SAM-dependent methyltransferase
MPATTDSKQSNYFTAAEVAARYATARPYFHAEVAERLRSFAGVERFALALDVGCGSGQSAVALAAIAEKVIAIDASAEMLRHATPLPNITYRVGLAEELESICIAGGSAAPPLPAAGAWGNAALPLPAAGAWGNAALPLPAAGAGGNAALPLPAAGAWGNAALPLPAAGAWGNAALPLPAAGAWFDVITAGSALHWFDRDRFYAQCHRVLRPAGVLAVYNDHFTSHMEGSVACKRWMRTRFAKRFPPPRRGMRDIDEQQATACGFAVAERSCFDHRVPFTREQLIGYLLTRSNVLAAIARGREDQQTVVTWLDRELAPIVRDSATEIFIFKCNIWLLRRADA